MGNGLGAGDQQSGHHDPLTSGPHTRPPNVDGLKEAALAAIRLDSVVSVCACNRRYISMSIRFASAFPCEAELTGHPVCIIRFSIQQFHSVFTCFVWT